MNPQHTVPILVDDEYILWESHAIIPYLVSKYAKDSFFYPQNLQKRGTVDNRLHFNNVHVFGILKEISVSYLYRTYKIFYSCLFSSVRCLLSKKVLFLQSF